MEISTEELLLLQSLGDELQTGEDTEPAQTKTVNPLNVGGTEVMKRNFLSQQQRKQVIFDLVSKADLNYSLKGGIINIIADKYQSNRQTISKIWKETVHQLKNDEDITVVTQKHKCGRKLRIVSEDALRVVPLNQRTTMRSFGNALSVSTSIIRRLVQRGLIKSHTNSIKPKLTEKHKLTRLKYILQYIIPTTVRDKPRFDMLYNMVHIDEKWFFMTKATQRFYLLSEEEDPYRSCQSKSFITKVMFMAAIARPWLDDNGEVLWDGKLGIFPFSKELAAHRGSRNKPRGTIETKPIQHINKDTIRRMVIEVVLPALREKWPPGACKTVSIQKDNARPHIQPDDPLFLEAANVDGFDLVLIQQPAQSPDLNILDLGFFRAIESIQHQQFPDTVPILIKSVKDAYEVYDPKVINHTWLHLMYVMTEILKVKGGNNYKNPHHGKLRLERLGTLPRVIDVDLNFLNGVITYLNSTV